MADQYKPVKQLWSCLYKPPAVTAVTVLSYVGKHSKINIIKNTSKFVFALLKQNLLYFSNSKRINIVYMFLEMHLKRYAAIWEKKLLIKVQHTENVINL